jgi:hypothetical protein
MSSPNINSSKPWLWFLLGSGSMLVLVAIVYGVWKLTHPKQLAIGGTWKIEASGGVPGSSLVTSVITPEGKIFVLTSDKEAVEIGKISNVSDVAALAEGVTIQTNPFAQQATKAKQSEARTYVGSLNKGQQAYFIEKYQWGQNVEVLGVGIKTETENYVFRTQTVPSGKIPANSKKDFGIAVQTGIAKKDGLKSYLGIVYLSFIPASSDVTSLAILCESNEPTKAEPPLSKIDGQNANCPEGYINTQR